MLNLDNCSRLPSLVKPRQELAAFLTATLALSFIFSGNSYAEPPTVRMMSISKALNPSPPFVWYDSCQNTPSGSSPHLVKRLLKQLGYQLEWIQTPDTISSQSSSSKSLSSWQALFLNQLNDGNIDLAIVPPTNRNPGLLKTKLPFATYQRVVVSRMGQPVPAKLEDLKERQGVIFFSRKSDIDTISTGIKRVLTQQKINYDITDTPTAAFQKIKRGQADFTISSPYLARAIAHKLKMSDVIYISKWTVIEQPYHLAMSKNNPNVHLIEEIDRLLNGYRENQYIIDKIHQAYMKKWINFGNCEPLTPQNKKR